MSRTRARRLARIGPAAIAGLLVFGSAGAQDVTEPALKAVYIYNFAKFTDWPAATPPSKEPFVLCVAGDAAVAEELVRNVKDRALGSQNLSVTFIAANESPAKCRLLYMSNLTSRQVASFVAGLRDLPVLTLSDLEGFDELGGIATFFFKHGRLRFSVNVTSAQRARLRISSKLLTMAIPK